MSRRTASWLLTATTSRPATLIYRIARRCGRWNGVSGIGGFFVRARDAEALNRRYAEPPGVVPPTGRYEDAGWFPDRGETVFTAFESDCAETREKPAASGSLSATDLDQIRRPP